MKPKGDFPFRINFLNFSFRRFLFACFILLARGGLLLSKCALKKKLAHDEPDFKPTKKKLEVESALLICQ
jgi:hypothetical protein